MAFDHVRMPARFDVECNRFRRSLGSASAHKSQGLGMGIAGDLRVLLLREVGPRDDSSRQRPWALVERRQPREEVIRERCAAVAVLVYQAGQVSAIGRAFAGRNERRSIEEARIRERDSSVDPRLGGDPCPCL